jgi:hypothetical protein
MQLLIRLFLSLLRDLLAYEFFIVMTTYGTNTPWY